MADFLNELAYAGSPYQGTANLSKMSPDFMSQFDQMSQEYYAQTGKEIKINDAFRTREQQAEGYRRKPNLVAPPGHSNHEKGAAMDIDETQANQLAEMGLFDKYGFHRPMMTKAPGKKYEPWHIEQMNFEKAGKIAATVKPDFMSELNAVGDFSRELGAIGKPPTGPSPAPTPQGLPGQVQGAGGQSQVQPGQPETVPGDFGGQPDRPGLMKPQPQQIMGQQPRQFTQDQLAQAEQQGEGVANLPQGSSQALTEATTWLKEHKPEIFAVLRPVLEYGGLAGGAAVGAAGGIPTGGVASPAMGVAGGALGYAGGKKAADALEAYAGQKPIPTMGESLVESGKDVATGAMYEMGGQAAGVALGKGAEYAGKAIRPVLGKMSGVGTGAVEEALKGSKDFVNALRGKITGEEVVENAQGALQSIRNARATEYQGQLAKISNIDQDIDMTPLNRKVQGLMKQYGAKANPDGTFDTSRIAMGKKGRNDIEDILETLFGKKDAKGKYTIEPWGSKPGDKTPIGLDTLKRQLDDFYSESSQARAFVSNLRNGVKDLIVKNVPEYAEMTKGYSDATKLIKDIESGLMMRKQGMTGRITADQTLRRLMSAMKDNFSLRKDLVDILGNQGGEDIAGQVAGHAMNTIVPRGLAGFASVTEGGLALAGVLKPQFWPILAASSPRLQGEFLQIFGRALKQTKGISMPIGKVTAYLSLMDREAKKSQSEEDDFLSSLRPRGNQQAKPKSGE